MTQQIDIGNLQLYPGQFLEFGVLKLGNDASFSTAIKAIKDSLANDDRWNYQGSEGFTRVDPDTGETQTGVTIVVQIRKSYQPTNEGGASLVTGFLPAIPVGYVLVSLIAGLVAGAIVGWKSSAIIAWIIAKDGNNALMAIWNNPNMPIEQKLAATEAIQANVESATKAASKPIVSVGGGMSLGLILVGGALLFAFFSGAMRRGS
jgi:hypothetical protein